MKCEDQTSKWEKLYEILNLIYNINYLYYLIIKYSIANRLDVYSNHGEAPGNHYFINLIINLLI